MATKKTATTKATTTTGTTSKTTTLAISVGQTGSEDQHMAEMAVAGVAGNAYAIVQYATATFGELSLTESVRALQASGKKINSGDLTGAENMLASQAAALNSIFCELARRAALNMGEYADAFERYMRLALKAQSQCRATLETLAAIKNPPVVFARLANINNGGQQQVNNGSAPESSKVRADAKVTDTAQQGGSPNSLPAPDAESTLNPTRAIFSPTPESNQSNSTLATG